MKRLLALVTCCSFVVTSCTFSKMTTINSDPTAAKVRLGGEEKGRTPVSIKLGCSGSSTKEIELSAENYRTLKANMEYDWKTSNIVWGIIFFWPSIFIWGKCPRDAYSFRLDKAVGSLEGKSTLMVTNLDSIYDLYVGGEKVVAGQRLVFEAGWQEVAVNVAGQRVPAGRFNLELNTDHVIDLAVQEAGSASGTSH